jgi:spore coat protein U-like protein
MAWSLASLLRGLAWHYSRQRRAFCLSLILLLGASTTALANRTCSISMTPVAFGNIDVTSGSPLNTTGTLTVTCSGYGGDPPRLCMSIGVGSAGDATSRQMLGPSSLRYELYRDAARTIVWGSWQTGYKSPGLSADTADGTFTFTVYASVSGSQQTVTPGSYSSTFTLDPFLRYGRTRDSSACPGPLDDEQTRSASFTTTATVLATCRVAATSMNFGSVAALSSSVDASSSITVRCTNGTPYNVGLSAGNGAGATVFNRKMTNAGSTVSYSLYINSARSTVWGNTVGTDTVGGTGSGNDQTLTVNGRVPAQATPAPANYADTIVVTVTY